MGSFRFTIERKVETKERDLRLFSFEPYSTDSFSLSLSIHVDVDVLVVVVVVAGL